MKLTLSNIKAIKRDTESRLTKRVCNYVISRWGDYNDKKHIFTDVLQVVEYLTHTIRQSPRLLIKNLIQKIVVYDDRFEIYYNYLNRMPPKTDDIGDKSIAETPPNTCSDISKDSSPNGSGKVKTFPLPFL